MAGHCLWLTHPIDGMATLAVHADRKFPREANGLPEKGALEKD